MTRRWLCGLFAILLFLGMMPSASLKAKADSAMQSSDELVEFLKKREGFSGSCYLDNTQRSVGYGTRCDVCDTSASNYPQVQTCSYTESNPISEEKATELVKKYLAAFENSLNKFLTKYDIQLNQHEFDALMSFTYNNGDAWMRNTSGIFNTAIRNGATGSELVYAMCLYSSSGSYFTLKERRMIEANMFLNGEYISKSADIPSNFRYVYLDGNGGIMEYIIHGFDTTDVRGITAYFSEIPTGVDADGNSFIYEFAGWYTAAEGGTKIELLDDSLARGTVLYAQWKDPAGNIVTLPKGDVLEPLEVTVTSKVTVRTGPGTFYSKDGTIAKDTAVTVSETFYYKKMLWGKVEQGWISLSYTDYDEQLAKRESTENENWPKNGTVTGNNVNVRPQPSTSSSVAYQLDSGAAVTISESYDDGNLVWGKLADGNWICLSYVTFDSTTETPTVVGLAMVKEPDQTEYVQRQDPLRLQGAVVQILYSDGSIGAMTPSFSDISGYDNTQLGEITITVTYEKKTTTFKVNIVKATVTFLNYDGSVISAAQYAYGETITTPETPTRPADEAGEYVFVGWDREVTACNGDAEYTAVFELASEQPPAETTQPSETTPPDDTTYILGDMDGSGVVDEDDAIYLLRYVFFPENYPIKSPADFNGDSVIDEDDAIYLLRHVFFSEEYPLTVAEG